MASVGPGSLLGEYLRAHWLPFLPAADLAVGAERPIRVQLLKERLVAFRNGRGEVGLIDALCPHAGADMFWGITEEDGLRCTYHGWKFAVDGACVDTPMHGPGRGFDTRAFPVAEIGGLLWTHLGQPDGESQPVSLTCEGEASLQRLGRPFLGVITELLSQAVTPGAPVTASVTEAGLDVIQGSERPITLTLPGIVSVGGLAAHLVIPADDAATIVIHLGQDSSSPDNELAGEQLVQIVGEAVARRFQGAIGEMTVQ